MDFLQINIELAPILTFLSTFTIRKVSNLTNKRRPKVLIVDDSAYDCNRSKKVELLVRCFSPI